MEAQRGRDRQKNRLGDIESTEMGFQKAEEQRQGDTEKLQIQKSPEKRQRDIEK